LKRLDDLEALIETARKKALKQPTEENVLRYAGLIDEYTKILDQLPMPEVPQPMKVEAVRS